MSSPFMTPSLQPAEAHAPAAHTPVVQSLLERGVIASLGHTHATYEEAVAAFDTGIHHVTHLFNAMPGLHHREPGPLTAIFENPQVTAQIITDGVHIHPAVLGQAVRAALSPPVTTKFPAEPFEPIEAGHARVHGGGAASRCLSRRRS